MLDLAQKWRADAATLRARAATSFAELLEGCAAELETYATERELEALTLAEGVEASGYSYSALQKLVASGEVENVGTKGSPRIRRGDLPKKAGHVPGPSLADAILARRLGWPGGSA